MLNKKLSKKIIFIILILSLFKPTWLLNNESLSVGSDDMSYWLHASTIAFDYDLTYIDDFNFDHTNYHPVTNTPFHSPGSGYAASVFVKIFSFFDDKNSLENIRMNPLGSYSLLGYLFSTFFYCALGFYFINKLLEIKNLHLNKKIIFLLIFVSSLAHYVSNRFLMAHSFEFFLVSYIFYKFETTNNIFNKRTFFLLSLSFFFLSITRPSTFIYTMSLFGIYLNKNNLKKNEALSNLLTIAGFTFLYTQLAQQLYKSNNFLIQLESNNTTKGATEYINLDWILNGISETPNLIFSFSMGLIWSTPIVLLGIFSLFKNNYLQDKYILNKLFIFFYLFGCFLVLYVWQGREGSFGQRLLIGIIPFCAYQLCMYLNNKSTKSLIPFLGISYLGILFLYSSSNLTLQYGTTLWNTIIDWAAEDYYSILISEVTRFENMASVFSRTIFFIDGIFLTNFFENLNIINSLEAERKSRLLNLIEVYNNLETTYFVMLNFTIIYFSFYLEKLTRK